MVVRTPSIRTREELLSVAEAVERHSASRYRELAGRVRGPGETKVAEEFEWLAQVKDRHVQEVMARELSRLAGKPVGPQPPEIFSEAEALAAEASPYQALAFAVRNEERAFVFYAYVAADAVDDATRSLAEDLAKDGLDRASHLRRLRRRAFHQDRPIDPEIPTSVEELKSLIQTWENVAAAQHAKLAVRLESQGRSLQGAIFRRLAQQEGVTSAEATAIGASPLSSAAEGLRLLEFNFDRLAWISERAKDEQVVAEAQSWAQRMVARLALFGGELAAENASVLAHE